MKKDDNQLGKKLRALLEQLELGPVTNIGLSRDEKNRLYNRIARLRKSGYNITTTQIKGGSGKACRNKYTSFELGTTDTKGSA